MIGLIVCKVLNRSDVSMLQPFSVVRLRLARLLQRNQELVQPAAHFLPKQQKMCDEMVRNFSTQKRGHRTAYPHEVGVGQERQLPEGSPAHALALPRNVPQEFV
jgi:hypothetical protein